LRNGFRSSEKTDQLRTEKITHPQNNQQNFARIISKFTLIHWAYYPSVAQNAHARDWLETQAMLGLAHNTVQAYGRGANDYLTFCERTARPFIEATKADIVAYVDDMTHRSNPKGENIRYLHSGVGLANSTMQQRLTVVRLLYD
jgi:integrase/recombinase XerD